MWWGGREGAPNQVCTTCGTCSELPHACQPAVMHSGHGTSTCTHLQTLHQSAAGPGRTWAFASCRRPHCRHCRPPPAAASSSFCRCWAAAWLWWCRPRASLQTGFWACPCRCPLLQAAGRGSVRRRQARWPTVQPWYQLVVNEAESAGLMCPNKLTLAGVRAQPTCGGADCKFPCRKSASSAVLAWRAADTLVHTLAMACSLPARSFEASRAASALVSMQGPK